MVAFSGAEAHFTFEVNVASSKKSHVQIGIQCADRHIQFRMIDKDVIRRLSLLNQRRNDFVFLMEFASGHVDAGSGITKFFFVFTVSKAGIVSIFVCYGAVVNFFGASIADIRCLIQPVAAFFFKILAGLVTSWTGSTFDTAENELATGISFLTVIPVDAEVLCIIKGSFMIPVGQAVCPDFLGYGGGILTQETSNVLKGSPFVQFVFNVDTVFKGKMLLITGNVFTHSVPPSTAVRRRNNFITYV